MAEFSKQYDEAFNFGLEDFDYEEIFNNLQPNQYIGQICEGLGTLAVAKTGDGKMLLAVPSEEDEEMVVWVTLETAIERVKDIED